MDLAKASNFWLLSGSAFLLLSASYAGSMHGWLQMNSAYNQTSTPRMIMQTDRPLSILTQNPVSKEMVSQPVSSIDVNDVKSETVLNRTNEIIDQTPKKTGTVHKQQPLQVSVTDKIVTPAKHPANMVTVQQFKEVPQPKALVDVISQPKLHLISTDERIVVKFPKHLAKISLIKKALSQLMLSTSPAQETDLLNNQKFVLSHKPYYFNRILDKSGHSIRYPAQAYEYAKVLLVSDANWVKEQGEDYLSIAIPLANAKPSLYQSHPILSSESSSRFDRYRQWANEYGQEFSIPSELIMAVMKVESNFDPEARSHSNAIGLMQIMADTAGRDVYEMVDGIGNSPSENELFNAKNNIRIGSAYLGLLQNQYFSKVKNSRSRQGLVIASYNAGLNKVLELFAKDTKAAIRKINTMQPQQIYRILRTKLPSKENREYLDKVMVALDQYLPIKFAQNS